MVPIQYLQPQGFGCRFYDCGIGLPDPSRSEIDNHAHPLVIFPKSVQSRYKYQPMVLNLDIFVLYL